ncbi:MAG: DNA alkylation repair protein [Clostridia bacterium]|nr:DNA alkylation repair protein [Clostridia bacterium]
MHELTERLLALRDDKNADFQHRILPTLDREDILGVRTPDIRRLAREFKGTPAAAEFMAQLPHRYFDENNLHGALIETIKDFDMCVAALDVFLPHVDNWATCDLISPKILGKQKEKLLSHIRRWMDSPHVYTCRFGLEALMRWYLDGDFRPEYLQWAAAVPDGEYYLHMMVAWYFATALAKQYDAALPYLTERKLSAKTHNKAIQKALESYRISAEQKGLLRTLKIKEDK